MEKFNIQEERKAYSIEETARILGTSSALIRKLVKNGTLKHVRLGERRILIPIDVIDDLIKETREGVS